MRVGIILSGTVLTVVGVCFLLLTATEFVMHWGMQGFVGYPGFFLLFAGIAMVLYGLLTNPKIPPPTTVYPSATPSATVPCPSCGKPLILDAQQNRWYCPNEKKYL